MRLSALVQIPLLGTWLGLRGLLEQGTDSWARQYISQYVSGIWYSRTSHDWAPDALPVPGLPVCSKHLLRGVDILVAGGAGVAGAPLGFVAVVSNHPVVLKFSFCPRTQTSDSSRRSAVFILFQSGDKDRITQMRKFRPGEIEEEKENNHNHLQHLILHGGKL